jgi:hypothetical protein
MMSEVNDIGAEPLPASEARRVLPGFRPPSGGEVASEIGLVLKGEGWAYVVILVDAYVRMGGAISPVANFSALFRVFNCEPTQANLEQIRRSGMLIEGGKRLAKEISQALIEASDESRWGFVRCWYDPLDAGWCVNLRSYLQSSDLLKVLPNSSGEFAISCDRGSWAMFLRDDEPFIFLAGPRGLIRRIVQSCPDIVMEVSSRARVAI